MTLGNVLAGLEGTGIDQESKLEQVDCSAPPALPPETEDAPAILENIHARMRYHSSCKYPSPPWQYQRYQSEGKQFIHVIYSPDTMPKEEKEVEALLGTQRRHAVALRKLSILGGLVKRIEAGTDIPQEKKSALLMQLAEEANRISDADLPDNTDEPEKQSLEAFQASLVNALMINAVFETEKEARDSLDYGKGAEIWSLAEYNRNQTLVFETRHSNGQPPTFQVDVPLYNAVSESVESALVKEAKDMVEGKPLWLAGLPAWEAGLCQQSSDPASDLFFPHQFKPSGSVRTPGIPNARRYYYLVAQGAPDEAKETGFDITGFDIICTNVKTGILVPFGVEDSIERARLTALNASYLVDYLEESLKKKAEVRHSAFRQDSVIPLPLVVVQSLVTGGQLPSLFGTLMSWTLFGGNNDTRQEVDMGEEEVKAIQALSAAHPDLVLLASNDPVNVSQHFTLLDWTFTDELIKYSIEFEAALDPEQAVFDRELIAAARKRLEEMKTQWQIKAMKGKKNFNMMLVTYRAILAGAMGMVSINCKSGKDRTGLAGIYISAMYECWRQYRRLPGYFDSSKSMERENFRRIFSEHYFSMEACELASMNAEGAFGIKDDGGLLCSDFRTYIDRLYAQGVRLAKRNKVKWKENPEKNRQTNESDGAVSLGEASEIRSVMP